MGATGGLSNEERVMRRLRSSEVKRCQRFTDLDHQYRRDVLQAFVDSIIPDNTTKRIKDELQKELDPLKALQIVRDHVPDTLLDAHRQQRRERREERREVILSAYRRSSP